MDKDNRNIRRYPYPLITAPKPIEAADSKFKLYIASTCGAWMAELLTFPCDLLKTRLQIQGSFKGADGKVPPKPLGLLGLTLDTLRHEGFFAFYNGYSVMIVRPMCFNSLRAVYYDFLRKKMTLTRADGTEYLPLPFALVAAAVAGAASQGAVNALDKAKVQMQVEGWLRRQGKPPQSRQMFKIMYENYKHGGIKYMYRGNVPSMMRASCLTMGDTAIYDLTKRKILVLTGLPDNRFVQFISSIVAGFFGTILCNPPDVLKSRVMNQRVDEQGRGLDYKNTLDCLIKSVRNEGFFSLYKGFWPCWIRVGPFTLAFWLTMEKVRSLQGVKAF